MEIEITRSVLDRMAIYAALGVREVWRYDGTKLSLWGLDQQGQYHELDESLCFPFLPLADVRRFLAARNETDETTWIRSFRVWVRELRA